MFDLVTQEALHPRLTFWLDVLDKAIKFAAVAIAGLWSWMNYKRSRTYAAKLELHAAGTVILKKKLYLEVSLGLKNLGASKYAIQQEGTVCDVVAIKTDMSTQPIEFFSIFELHEWIEPGESIGDSKQCVIPLLPEEIVWLQINLRIVSGETEWNLSRLVKVK